MELIITLRQKTIVKESHIDKDPLDESGHGTHVAGTIAGIGDNINTHNGVAPAADLYAIKVFEKKGSTSNFVVIVGLEYAVDPNRDGNPDDRMDILNLSLGSSYGVAYTLYDKAISNIHNANISIVTSAGNSGTRPYIVGSPGTSEHALSVASSIDHSLHNWNFHAIDFYLGEAQEKLTRVALLRQIGQAREIWKTVVEIIDTSYADRNRKRLLFKKLNNKIALMVGGITVLQKT